MGHGLTDFLFCFVLFCFLCVSHKTYYESNVKKKAEIHVASFHELDVIIQPRIFIKHTVVLGFITEKNGNIPD